MAVRYLRQLCFILLAPLAMSASAQTITLKVHHFLPPASTTHARFIVPWCEKIAKESSGKLKCQI